MLSFGHTNLANTAEFPAPSSRHARKSGIPVKWDVPLSHFARLLIPKLAAPPRRKSDPLIPRSIIAAGRSSTAERSYINKRNFLQRSSDPGLGVANYILFTRP